MSETETPFDPYNNRRHRDLRNRLSTALVASLLTGDPGPFAAEAVILDRLDPDPAQRRYLADRDEVLARLLNDRAALTGVWDIAIALWNHGLFFEVHEIVEDAWREALGAERDIMQAMIRAAGGQVHRAGGNEKGARRMAARAWPVLEKYLDRLPIANGGELIAGLKSESLILPRLLQRSVKTRDKT